MARLYQDDNGVLITRRNTPLPPDVYQDVADIRRRREIYRRGAGPLGSGIYFLFVRWALVYVGQSVRVADRLHSHFMNRVDRRTRLIPFNKFSVIEVPRPWLDDVEIHYIRALKPPFNIKDVP